MCNQEVNSANGGGDASQVAPFDKTGTKVAIEQLLKEQIADPDLVQEFVCKICLVNVVGDNPKLTCCSHLFCGDCLDKWFAQFPGNQSWAQRAKSSGAVPCPVCKTPLRNGDVFPVAESNGTSALLWRMISSLQIVCVNNAQVTTDGFCSWTGSLGEYQAHLAVCGKEAPPLSKCDKEPAAKSAKPAEELATQPGHVSAQEKISRPEEVVEDNSALLQHPTEGKGDGKQHTEEPGQGDGDAICDGGNVVPAAKLPSSMGQTTDASQATPEKAKDYQHDIADEFFSDEGELEEEDEEEGEQMEQEEHQDSSCPESALAEDAVKASLRPLIPENASISDCIQTWVHLESAKKNGWSMATCSFVGSTEQYLSLTAGDMVTVLEKHTSGWTYGRKEFATDAAPSVPAGAEGWFPNWALKMK